MVLTNATLSGIIRMNWRKAVSITKQVQSLPSEQKEHLAEQIELRLACANLLEKPVHRKPLGQVIAGLCGEKPKQKRHYKNSVCRVVNK